MSIVMSESELRGHCRAAGQTCKTEMGCTCAAGKFVGIGDYVQGPTDWGALDNPENEPEQEMAPPVWLGYLLLIGVGFALGMIVDLIWRARP